MAEALVPVPPMSDPSLAFSTPLSAPAIATGMEPLLGGALRQKAVWVDEAVCIGCRYCAHVAVHTFVVESNWGRSRAIRQDGDSTERIQEAIDTSVRPLFQYERVTPGSTPATIDGKFNF